MNQIIILGHDNPDVDSVFSGVLLERFLKKNDIDSSYVIPDKEIDEETEEICRKYGIFINDIPYNIPNDEVSYILVDHHDRKLNKTPIAIYDHHPDNEFTTNCPNYINNKACSTSCILGKEYEDIITKEDFILILVSALVDTASFHSIKTVPKDIEWLKRMCNKFSINMDDYYNEGLCLTDVSNISQASFHGLKKYEISKKKFESSYIQIQKIEEKKETILKILDILKRYVIDKSLYEFVFLIHDMDKFKSYVYHIYPDSIDIVQYDEYVSRGHIVIPEVKNRILENNKKRI